MTCYMFNIRKKLRSLHESFGPWFVRLLEMLSKKTEQKLDNDALQSFESITEK